MGEGRGEVRALRLLRFCAGLGVALTLGGCNMVVSHDAVFGPSDAKGAEVLRPGSWSLTYCADPAAPSLCRPLPITIGPDTLSVVGDPGRPPDSQFIGRHEPYLMVAGAPELMQLHTIDPDSHEDFFFFLAIEPTAHDDQGRITALNFWPVECGPPPKPGDADYDENDDNHDTTRRPLPGLTLDDQGFCTAKDRASLLNAATASRGWYPLLITVRWERDETP